MRPRDAEHPLRLRRLLKAMPRRRLGALVAAVVVEDVEAAAVAVQHRCRR